LTRTLPTTLSHPRITWVKGDLKSKDDIQQLLTGEEAVHLNLSVKQTEKEKDWHTEGEGLQNLLSVAKQSGIKQISYLSSLIMYYQGMNEFDWWVFKLKQCWVVPDLYHSV
jgi:nucleoside-diphosphate-sugar epimerase